MANPQRENGHIDIANELADEFAKIRISGEEWQVLWVILRKTWGWLENPEDKLSTKKKKMDTISFSLFEKLTGLKRASVFRAIKKLSAKNIIISNKANSYIVSYGIQKDYDRWKPLAKKLTLLAIKQQSISKKANETISILTDHKRKVLKETNTKDILSDKPTEKKIVKKTNPDIKKVIDSYHDKFLTKFNVKPVISGGQAGTLIGKMLEVHNFDKIEELLIKFFDCKDNFVLNSDYSIGVFFSQVNKLMIKELGKQNDCIRY